MERQQLSQQNFLTMLYANDSFLKIKEQLTEEMLQSQQMSSLLNEQKSLLSDVDQQLEEIKKWRERQKEKEKQRQLEIEREDQKNALEAVRALQLKTLLEGQEQDEQEEQHRLMMRKNELDLTEIENLKIKKNNNAKEILN